MADGVHPHVNTADLDSAIHAESGSALECDGDRARSSHTTVERTGRYLAAPGVPGERGRAEREIQSAESVERGREIAGNGDMRSL